MSKTNPFRNAVEKALEDLVESMRVAPSLYAAPDREALKTELARRARAAKKETKAEHYKRMLSKL